MPEGRKFPEVGVLLLVFVFCHCLFWSGSLAAQTDKGPETVSPSPVQNGEVQLTYQDYANLIAGKKVDSNILAKYVNPEGWSEYAGDIDQTWNRFEQKNLNPMRAWATQELGASQAVATTVFYPFSGPDLVNMFAFFPNAKTYLLIALEPLGTLPVLQPGANTPFYSGLELAISELLQFNFFFTKKMEKDLVKKELDGVLPVLLFFLGRERVRLLDVQYWLMQPDGSIIEKAAKAGEQLTGEGIPGVKIVFQRREGEPDQTLYYFQFNLLNTFWQKYPKFVSFLKSFEPFQTFVKAASYLMFKPKFGDIRQFILDKSQLVLQTDEGIPLKYFDPGIWQRRFYGKYSCPIQLFSNCYQPDLAGMYQGCQNAQPLPFGIGYHHRRHSSNLMIASRKAVVAEEVAK